jgi:molybdate transport system substrate-binding protein
MIKLISSMATREVLADLIARYQTSTSSTVMAEAGGGVDVARRVQQGESFDVVVLAATAIDQLITDGKLLAGSRVDLVKSGVAMAVRSGAPLPDISTEDAVKQAVVAARTISFSTGPSGVYLLKLFGRWGILEAIKPRIVQAPPGVPVGSLVAKGEVELGFQQLSELINLNGIVVLGLLPPAIQTITTFSAGVCATSLQAGLAAGLIEFMAAPEAASAKRKQGMEPA